MIKNLLYVILFLVINPSLDKPRVVNGYIEYAILYKEKTINKEKSFKKEKKEVIVALSEIRSELFFNSETSIYRVKPILGKENDMPYKVARIIAGNEWYKNSSKQSNVERIKTMGEIFNVTRPFNTYKWEILEDSKIIGGYKTYKAKATFIEKNNFTNKIDSLFISAWFCPDIPFSYGPKGVDGLPGLVLEADFGSVSIKANVINLNASGENSALQVPANGINITEKEFNELRKKRYGGRD